MQHKVGSGTLFRQTFHWCHLKLEGLEGRCDADAVPVDAIAIIAILTGTFPCSMAQSLSITISISICVCLFTSTLQRLSLNCSVHHPSDTLSPLASSSPSLPPHTHPLIPYPLDFLFYGVYLWLRLTTSAFLLDKPSLDPTNDHSNLSN